MLLEPQELDLFFRLHRTFMFFVNQRLNVLSDEITSPQKYSTLAPDIRAKVHDAFLENMDLIQTFVEENPADLTDDELNIVRSWQHLVHGKFYIFRELKKHTIFLSEEEEPIAYGVLALSHPFEEMVGPNLPVMVQTVLLPFQNKIVYDGLMVGYNVSFGPGVRRSLNEAYKEAKARHGIVTSLPMSDAPPPAKKTKTKKKTEASAKEEKEEVLATIIGLIDEFCSEHLNEEYALVCRKMAEKLARKRPSPLLRGNPSTWASGIVRAIGWVNFLNDNTQTPYMRMSDVDAGFGVSESGGAAKLKAIREILNIHPLDPTWTLPSRLEDNPMVWMLEINGLLMDVRHAPREVQEIAFQKGLVPYIPADRGEKTE